MEPESSLSYTQEPTTCLNPEPDKSSPCTRSHFLKIHFNIIIQLTLWVYQIASFHHVSLPKPCMSCSSPHTCYTLRLSYAPWKNFQLQLQIFISITEIKKDMTQALCRLTPLNLHQLQSKTRDDARIFNVNTKFPRERRRREGETGRRRETVHI